MARPTKYKKEYNEQVIKLCRLGATDIELADFFNVSESTLNTWKKEYPEFLESIKKGKIESDAEIANSLYNRAKGYSHKDTDIRVIGGQIVETPIEKHYPPDTGAAFIWLKNRQPKKWRDKQEISVEQEEVKKITIEVVNGRVDNKS